MRLISIWHLNSAVIFLNNNNNNAFYFEAPFKAFKDTLKTTKQQQVEKKTIKKPKSLF